MFETIKKMFIVLLTNMIVNSSNHTKYQYLSNHKCEIQPTLINLHCNEHSQECHYYSFAVKLGRCVVRSCNTLNDSSNEVCVPDKTEDLNLRVFKMITGINELKTLTKYRLCECKRKFDWRKYNLNQWWNCNKCWCQCNKNNKNDAEYIWNPVTCSCENGKYLAKIMDDSTIMWDEIIVIQVETKTIPKLLMKEDL